MMRAPLGVELSQIETMLKMVELSQIETMLKMEVDP